MPDPNPQSFNICRNNDHYDSWRLHTQPQIMHPNIASSNPVSSSGPGGSVQGNLQPVPAGMENRFPPSTYTSMTNIPTIPDPSWYIGNGIMGQMPVASTLHGRFPMLPLQMVPMHHALHWPYHNMMPVADYSHMLPPPQHPASISWHPLAPPPNNFIPQANTQYPAAFPCPPESFASTMPHREPNQHRDLPQQNRPNPPVTPTNRIVDEIVRSRSSQLELFYSRRSPENWSLKDLIGHIAEFSCDKYGSRLIQEKVTVSTGDEKRAIFDELVPSVALHLMYDEIGNYVMQKLYEQGTQSQKIRLAATMEGSILALSIHPHGCRVVQKAFEHVLPNQQLAFLNELEPHMDYCVRHPQAHFVIERIIERVQPEHLSFVDSIIASTQDLATDRYGCHIIQRCIQHIPRQMILPLLTQLDGNAESLITDQYGNYVMQYILERGNQEDTSALISKMRGQFVRLSCNKHGSNVCEKALALTDGVTRAQLIDELLISSGSPEETPAYILANHHFGNYVLQRALGLAVGEQKNRLMASVRDNVLLGPGRPKIADKRLFMSNKSAVS
ncbi:mRNA binding protein puf3 [Paramarasmius palmivorus]|uniref:mRNA binding protein puf3 n=1 Tax=Paramarasmius palmivorus TaxID=297713 RepID=A0AAW0C317_9AGAR